VHLKSKQETFDVLGQVPTSKKIFNGKLRSRAQNMKLCTIARMQTSTNWHSEALSDDWLYGMKLGVAIKTF
jgi:hypothetical protein